MGAGQSGLCGGGGPLLEIDLGSFTLTLDSLDYARPEFVREHPKTGDEHISIEAGVHSTKADSVSSNETNGSSTSQKDEHEQQNIGDDRSDQGVSANSSVSISGNTNASASEKGDQNWCVPMLMYLDLPEP